MKKVEELEIDDLKRSPVWEFVTPDDPNIRPVIDLPVSSLDGRAVGTEVHLANGRRVWALLSNFSLKDPRMTKQCLTASFNHKGSWFHFARYFDVDYDERGPHQLAEFLGLPVQAIFPISYDISPYVNGAPLVLKGHILFEPEERLSSDELIDLILLSQAGEA